MLLMWHETRSVPRFPRTGERGRFADDLSTVLLASRVSGRPRGGASPALGCRSQYTGCVAPALAERIPESAVSTEPRSEIFDLD